MKKLVKSAKSSFTLLETLLSIFLLSIIIVGFAKISPYDNFDKEFLTLNEVENSFNTSSYNSSFTTKNEKIILKINNVEEKEINVKKVEYFDDSIKVFKYEL